MFLDLYGSGDLPSFFLYKLEIELLFVVIGVD